jgi:tryptophan 7-halogenase
MNPINNVLVLGGGSAGLLAALTIRHALPSLEVRLVYSSDIGIIGVGEGTTPVIPRHLLDTLGLDPAKLYAEAQPTWKLGIRFLWGPRPEFYYSFTQQFEARWSDLPKANGFYCNNHCPPADLLAAMMSLGKAALRRGDGWPQLHSGTAFHIENAKLVSYLTNRCEEAGVVFTEGTVERAETDETGVTRLHLKGGKQICADLYVDASGFRSELLGRSMGEPFESYENALFCDRAVVAGWQRTSEPLLAYTTAETMDAGWCWQIEHEQFINRGYVFCSRFISDDDARAEFLSKNSKISAEPRLVRFRSGRYRQNWVGNVVAVGNASGFVEPLEATALSILVLTVNSIVETLREGLVTEGLRAVHNEFVTELWEETRDFLALHYRYNRRLDTPFWEHCRAETPLQTVGPLVEFYQENGPSALGRLRLQNPDNIFGIEGHLALLVGQRVPHIANHEPSPPEAAIWSRHCNELLQRAQSCLTATEALKLFRHPAWSWK